jgi:hypothetical protein
MSCAEPSAAASSSSLIRRLRCLSEEIRHHQELHLAETHLLRPFLSPVDHRSAAAHGDQSQPPELPPPASTRLLPCRPHPGEHFLEVPYLSSTRCAAHLSPLMPRSPVIWLPRDRPSAPSTRKSGRLHRPPPLVSTPLRSPRSPLSVLHLTRAPSFLEPCGFEAPGALHERHDLLSVPA